MSNIVKSEINLNNSKKKFVLGDVSSAPKIIFDMEALERMKFIVKYNSIEAGWYALVNETNEGLFVSDCIYVKNHVANGGTCEFDEMLAVDKLFEMTGSPEGISKMRFWGHSHHTMGVGPSSQDEETITTLATRSDRGLFIRGIFNKAGLIGLTVLDSVNMIRWDNLPYTIKGTLGTKEELECLKTTVACCVTVEEIKELVGSFATNLSIDMSKEMQAAVDANQPDKKPYEVPFSAPLLPSKVEIDFPFDEGYSGSLFDSNVQFEENFNDEFSIFNEDFMAVFSESKGVQERYSAKLICEIADVIRELF